MMKMTEDEAKTKRCPAGVGELSLVSEAGVGVPLRRFGATCIGSDCMAWRSTPSVIEPSVMAVMMSDEPARQKFIEAISGARGFPWPKEAAFFQATGAYPQMVSAGYCGLAGAPQ